MNNSIFVLKPYRFNGGTWVFDDEATGLVREAFVGGADTILDVATAEIPHADRGFTLIFSAAHFPGAQLRLDKLRGDYTGTYYRWEEKGIDGWLCPALFLYFPQAPDHIYVQTKPIGGDKPQQRS